MSGEWNKENMRKGEEETMKDQDVKQVGERRQGSRIRNG